MSWMYAKYTKKECSIYIDYTIEGGIELKISYIPLLLHGLLLVALLGGAGGHGLRGSSSGILIPF